MFDRRVVGAIVLVLFVALVALAASGCAADSQSPGDGGTQDSGGESTSGDAPGDASEMDGDALVDARCTECHSRVRIDSAVKNRDEWATTVERMRRNGADMTDEERDAIVEYLSTR